MTASCVTATTIYAYATSGTTTKTAYNVPVVSGSVPPCSGLVVLSQTEYAAYQTGLTTLATVQSTQASQSTTLTNLNGTVTGYGTTINGLQGSVTTDVASIASMQNDIALIKGGAAAFTGVAGTPNPDVIAAQSMLFGVMFTAAALIWGGKKVLSQFRSHTGDD